MLTHEESGRQARLCESCLEMSVRLQADAQNLGSDRVLDAYAQAADGQIWRTQHVRYVMPSRLDDRLLAQDALDVPGSAPGAASDDGTGAPGRHEGTVPATGRAQDDVPKSGSRRDRSADGARRFEERVADQH